ncbi:hypothetical protein [Blastococcus sp. Marseille-P5729]|nr:hypothetical protein [Blastococcus sp. Marseille-P5729]
MIDVARFFALIPTLADGSAATVTGTTVATGQFTKVITRAAG